MIEDGLHVYIGTTGVAKTHLAIRHAIELAGMKRQGLLVIDSRGAQNLVEIREYKLGSELYEEVFRKGGICRVVPNSTEEFDTVIKLCDKLGNLVIMIDEVKPWANNTTLLSLCRVWRHRKVALFITTQMFGRDIEQGIFACNPLLYIFRLTAPRSLEWVEKWHKIPIDRLKALGPGDHYKVRF